MDSDFPFTWEVHQLADQNPGDSTEMDPENDP